MPIVYISTVDAPERVYPNVDFNIKIKQSYITWPFQKLNLITKIEKNGKLIYNHVTKITPWWFWGSIKHNILEQIPDDTIYDIKVGYTG